MKEVFITKKGLCEFSDEGIAVHSSSQHRFYPYGSLKKVKYGTFLESFDIVSKYGYCAFEELVTPNEDCERALQAAEYAREQMRQAPMVECYDIPPLDEAALKEKMTHNMHCKMCGFVFCYTEDDVKQNEKNKKNSNPSGLAIFGITALTGSLFPAYSAGKEADKAQAKIIDFSKCPQCNSSELEELTKEEIEKLKTQDNSVTSPVEEIKKYKELLDSGIITQEEFEAKKKQLLGL